MRCASASNTRPTLLSIMRTSQRVALSHLQVVCNTNMIATVERFLFYTVASALMTRYDDRQILGNSTDILLLPIT